MDAFYMTLDSSEFRLYSCPEILQLSVKEITNFQIFDVLGNPVTNGLYDRDLGPIDRHDRCGSCGQSEMNCPGHFGHIRLPVLLYNSVLFPNLLTLLHGSCMTCHRVLLPSHVMDAYAIAITLLRKGLIIEALTVLESFLKGKSCDTERENEMKLFAKKYKNVKLDGKVISKHILTLLKGIVATITKKLKTSSRKCLHCESKNRALKAENHCLIVGNLVKAVRKTKSEKMEEEARVDQKDLVDMTALVEEEVEMDQNNSETEEADIKQEIDEVLEEGFSAAMQTEIDQFVQCPDQRCILSPYVAQQHLREVWKNDKKFLKAVFPFLAQVSGLNAGTDVFFLDVVAVSPSRFRPISMMKGRRFEHELTTKYAKIISECEIFKQLMTTYLDMTQRAKDNNGEVQGPSLDPENDVKTVMQKLMSTWLQVQTIVNSIFDGTLDKKSRDISGGVRQILEKKQGLFRTNMMGKRVNYAARSVISPDPYIAVNQIGIPLIFASALTYPQPVTPWNVHMLRQLVINGPNKYPGAYSIISEDGSVTKLNSKDPTQREALANQLLVPDKNTTGYKIVCRHLLNGDYVLLNRQPTLHRPSIQAHKTRVLSGIKTLRLHYANCKAYNADFDGDEMNVHFPQDEIGRAEAATLAGTDYQYLVPKDGTPLAGLIQDHMVAGVTLTTRGRFFNKHDYCGLLWSAMNDWNDRLDLLPPAIIKPRALWSGKQIISTIILNLIPKDQTPFNLNSNTKIPEKSWISPEIANRPTMTPIDPEAWASTEMGESTVVFRQGELLQGVLDKAHYGPSSYGLVHSCYELYGGVVAGKLLTYLGRLFTSFLQMIGFSLGVGDILVLSRANKARKVVIKKSHLAGKKAVSKTLGLNQDEEIDEAAVLEGLKQAQFGKDTLKMAEIDLSMKRETDVIQDSISKAIMPWGLEKKFPQNSLQLMVQSGAKGSPVNCMQISCLLGQIELEGQRPPLMVSGRSLPCFLPYDMSPQAGGFVSGRFLSGIRPAEYFFHCMAGREGLIDTAVKTSRSGYLQRCLVKHLEGIMVNYDMTVRDSDGGLLQFYYGEDGLETTRSSYLQPSQFPFLTDNLSALQGGTESPWLSADYSKSVRKTWKKISKWRAETNEAGSWVNRENGFHHFCLNQSVVSVSETENKTLVKTGKYRGRSEASRKLCEAWFVQYDDEERKALIQRKSCPDPVMSRHLPHSQPDVLSENFRHLVNVYCKKGLEKVTSSLPEYAKVDQEMFKTVINKRLVRAMAHPGEAVGLLCAQSIGEPSTQMTLNTFHFAGRGEMNVTLGIPRLREILMIGAAMPKTPQVDVPIRPIANARETAEKLRAKLTKVTLNQLLEYIHVKINSVTKNGLNYKTIEMTFKCLRHSHYRDVCDMKYMSILECVVRRFIPNLRMTFKKENKMLSQSKLLTAGQMRRSPAVTLPEVDEPTEAEMEANESNEVNEANEANEANENVQGDEDSDDDEMNNEPDDGDATTVKERQRHQDTTEYEGEDEERQEIEEVNTTSATTAIPGDNDRCRGDDEDSEPDEPITEEEEGEEEEVEELDNNQTDGYDKYVAKEDLNAQCKKLLEKALSNDNVIGMQFAETKKRSFTITFQYPPNEVQFDVRLLLEKLVKSFVVQQVPGIIKAIVTEEKENEETVLHLKTDGINIQHLFNYPDILDLNRIYSNSIHHMWQMYGVEAANRVILKEVQNVFGAYGITVDYHHLSLLADYMTSRGLYDSCSRLSMQGNQTSTYQKITFETSMNFLKDACLNAFKDNLTSPSSQIVMGKQVSFGTGCFDILARH